MHSRPGRSAGADQVCETVHNVTRALSEEIDAAIAAILSFTMLAIVIAYFITVGVLYIKKCVKKHKEKLAEEELELMETRLQERKTKRRAAAAKAKSSSPQE